MAVPRALKAKDGLLIIAHGEDRAQLVPAGALAADRARAKGDEPGNPPTMFQTTLRDSDGVRPCIPIRDMLAWSQTKHGGRQMKLVADWGREAGCVRWGMCEGVLK